MRITDSKENRTRIVKIDGRLDASNANQLEEALEGQFADVDKLVLDLTELDYLASAGIRVMLKAYKAMKAGNGTVTIRGANEEITDVLTITGFAGKVEMERG